MINDHLEAPENVAYFQYRQVHFISYDLASLGNAAASAEKVVGINSHTTSANLGEERGYLVYTVRIVDGNSNSHKVIVDAGNGRVLFAQSIFDDQEEHSNNSVVYRYHDHHHHDNE